MMIAPARAEAGIRSATAGDSSGRRRARYQSAEDAGRNGAFLRAEELGDEVGGQADSDDQDDHQPDREWIEHAVAVISFVGKNRQDDQSDQRKPRDRIQFAGVDPIHIRMEAGLALEQDGEHARHNERDGGVAKDESAPDGVGGQQRDLAGQADIRPGAVPRQEIAQDQQGRDGDESGGRQPGAA